MWPLQRGRGHTHWHGRQSDGRGAGRLSCALLPDSCPPARRRRRGSGKCAARPRPASVSPAAALLEGEDKPRAFHLPRCGGGSHWRIPGLVGVDWWRGGSRCLQVGVRRCAFCCDGFARGPVVRGGGWSLMLVTFVLACGSVQRDGNGGGKGRLRIVKMSTQRKQTGKHQWDNTLTPPPSSPRTRRQRRR